MAILRYLYIFCDMWAYQLVNLPIVFLLQWGKSTVHVNEAIYNLFCKLLKVFVTVKFRLQSTCIYC